MAAPPLYAPTHTDEDNNSELSLVYKHTRAHPPLFAYKSVTTATLAAAVAQNPALFVNFLSKVAARPHGQAGGRARAQPVANLLLQVKIRQNPAHHYARARDLFISQPMRAQACSTGGGRDRGD